MDVPIIGQQSETDQIKQQLGSLMQGLQFLAQENKQIRMYLSQCMKQVELTTLKFDMAVNIMIENGLLNEEQAKEKFDKEVVEKFQEMEKTAMEEAKKMYEQQQKELEKQQDLSNNVIKEAQAEFQKQRKNKK